MLTKSIDCVDVAARRCAAVTVGTSLMQHALVAIAKKETFTTSTV